MNSIDPIRIIINLRTIAIAQRGFNLPIIFGDKLPSYFATILTGTAGLIWKAKTPGVVHIRVVYEVSGNNTALAVARTGTGTEGDPYIITVTVATDANGDPTSTASAIKIAAEAVVDVNSIVEITAVDGGAGVVSAVGSTALDYERYMLITEVSELADLGFTSDDAEWKAVAAMFSQRNRPARTALYLVKSWAGIADEIAELLNNGKSGWYKAFATTRTPANIHYVATAIDSIKGLFFGCSSQTSVLVGRSGDREAYLLHLQAENYPEMRLVGGLINKEVGSFTYAYKSATGVPASGFSNTVQAQILKENGGSDAFGNVIANYSGIPVMWEGKTAFGNYIDIVEAADYLEARLREDLARMNVNADKIDFTPDGIEQYEAVISNRLNQLGDQRIIAPILTEDEREEFGADKNYKFSFELPDFATIPANDKANRTLPFIRVKAILAGAIHQGTVEIDLMP